MTLKFDFDVELLSYWIGTGERAGYRDEDTG
jgi:hypothetical protein